MNHKIIDSFSHSTELIKPLLDPVPTPKNNTIHVLVDFIFNWGEIGHKQVNE